MGSAETRGAGASKNALNSPTMSANLEDCKRRCAIVGRVFRNSPGQIHLLSWSSGQEGAPPRKENPSKREQEARDHGERQRADRHPERPRPLACFSRGFGRHQVSPFSGG